MKSIQILALLLAAIVPASHAAEKQTIRLQFQLARPDWVDKIAELEADRIASGEQRDEPLVDELTKDIENKLATVFNDELKFANFVTTTDEPVAITLKISLVARGVAGYALQEADFKLEILGLPDVAGPKEVTLNFTEGYELLPITENFFRVEPEKRMRNELILMHKRIVDGCLSHVPLTETIFLVRLTNNNKTYAVLPWSHDDLGVATESEFRVKKFDVAGDAIEYHTHVIHEQDLVDNVHNEVTAEFKDGVIVKDHPPAEPSHVEPLETIEIPPNLVQIKGLYMKVYKRMKARDMDPPDNNPLDVPWDG
jgi:hypothetical protein